MIPAAWKRASVVPIFKSGIASQITNYRPILLLLQIVKTFEKLIHTRLYNYVEFNGILAPEQGGFLPKLGTNDTIGKFWGDTYTFVNGGDQLYAFFFI